MGLGGEKVLINNLLQCGIDGPSVVAMMQALDVSNGEEHISSVRVGNQDVVLKAGETKIVSCNLTSSVTVHDSIPVLFEPETDELLPQKIQIAQAIVRLKKGVNKRVRIAVTNEGTSDIRLTRKLNLGTIEPVTFIAPIDVTPVTEAVLPLPTAHQKQEEPKNTEVAGSSPGDNGTSKAYFNFGLGYQY